MAIPYVSAKAATTAPTSPPRDGVAVCDSVANICRCHHDFSRGGLLPRYALAFAQRSGRNAFFQSGMAEIFFSRRRTSASRCKLGTRSEGKLGLTSTRASALAKDFPRHVVAFRREERIDHVRDLRRVVLEVARCILPGLEIGNGRVGVLLDEIGSRRHEHRHLVAHSRNP